MVTETTNEELVIAYQAGDASALDKLLAINHDYIAAVAKRFASKADPDDRMQLARIALFHSARLFDPTRGIKFNTYLYRAVANRVIRWRTVQDREPRPSGMPTGARRQVVELLADHGPSPLQQAIENERRADDYLRLQLLLSRLQRRDRLVIELRLKGWPMTKIGRKLGVCHERIRQLEKRAMYLMSR